MFNNFLSLVFPEVCASCGKGLNHNEHCICFACLYHLPKTNYHLVKNNPVEKLFWGRANIKAASAFYRFEKGSNVQRLIHQLKYRGRKEVGIKLGQIYGKELAVSDFANVINLIIPVPLHKKRLRKRGFNQSELFAEGLSESLNIELKNDVLFRKLASKTQTKKSRFSRWSNVEYIFEIKNHKELVGKHILLVDDVVTTGSTLEACAKTILEIPETNVSIATIAFAEL